jgi:hypothetical protein
MSDPLASSIGSSVKCIQNLLLITALGQATVISQESHATASSLTDLCLSHPSKPSLLCLLLKHK